MSATLPGAYGPDLGTGVDVRPSTARLTAAELRKAVDTRAGFWLVVSIAALTIVVVSLQLAFAHDDQRTLRALVVNAQLPVSVLLPVLGVLLVTSEWSQRTALGTFTLVPGRLRVVGAKALAASLLSLVAAVTGTASGLLGFTVGQALGRTTGGWDLPAVLVPQLLLYQWLSVIGGIAFGLLFLSSAPAIVAYFVLPISWSIAGAIVPALESVAGWLDLARTMAPLTDAGITAREWGQLLASTGLWTVLPAVIGLARVRRSEIS